MTRLLVFIDPDKFVKLIADREWAEMTQFEKPFGEDGDDEDSILLGGDDIMVINPEPIPTNIIKVGEIATSGGYIFLIPDSKISQLFDDSGRILIEKPYKILHHTETEAKPLIGFLDRLKKQSVAYAKSREQKNELYDELAQLIQKAPLSLDEIEAFINKTGHKLDTALAFLLHLLFPGNCTSIKEDNNVLTLHDTSLTLRQPETQDAWVNLRALTTTDTIDEAYKDALTTFSDKVLDEALS